MDTTVTYNGVESTSGGNIFKDVKFWVAQRVPARNDIMSMIRDNGGTVVPLEKNADMLIADHARKDIPPGSYSWKFITESVEHGIIQLKDRYQCGPDPQLPRQVGTGGVTKGTRTPYNKADDAALAKWVLAHQLDRTAGNKIFQEFEQINPRHTWQSWRDRFVKTLRPLGREQLERIAASAPKEQPAAPASRPERQPEPESREQPTVASQQVTEPDQPVVAPPLTRPAEEFTRDPPVEVVEERAIVSIEAEIVVEEEAEEVLPDADQQVVEENEDIDQRVGGDALRSQPPESSPIPGSEATDTARQEFYDDLNEFMETNEIDIKLQQNINGIVFELWDLAQAVQAQQTNSQMVDWRAVASELGLRRDLRTSLRLKDCYQESLADFLQAMQSFEEELEEEAEDEIVVGGVEDEGEEEVEETQPANNLEVSRSTPVYFPSSPPVVAGTKRLRRDLTSSGPSLKRKRFDKGAEIPSTPDEKIGVIRPLTSTQNLSPSIRRHLLRQEYMDESEASQQLPPLPEAMVDEEEPEEEEEEEEGQDVPGEEQAGDEVEEEEVAGAELEEVPAIEEQPAPDIDNGQSQDITPSQQLRKEGNPSPIPLNLNKGRQAKHPTIPDRSIRPSAQQSQPSKRSRQPRSPKTTAVRPTAPKSTPSQPPRSSLPSSSRNNTPLRHIPGALPPRRAPSSNSNAWGIHDWVAHYEAQGFSHNIVVEGLKRTTLTPGSLATLVMQSLRAGQDVPSHHEGIWTDRDDADLSLANSIDIDEVSSHPEDARLRRRAKRAADRLLNKHGQARMDLRKAFLEAENSAAAAGSGS